MPVSPTCRVPPMTLMWSPILKNFCSSSVENSSGSRNAACLGSIVTVLPSAAIVCTTPVKCLRSPSITLTVSPTPNMADEPRGACTACSSSSSAPTPRPALKRSSSAREGTMSSPQRSPRVDMVLIRQPSSKCAPSYPKYSRPPPVRCGPVTSPPRRWISSGRKSLASGRTRLDCSPSWFIMWIRSRGISRTVQREPSVSTSITWARSSR
mmetsp:Transcript_36367/g.95599  ORF Transcript_36367/g.95599 Transcript_36367/m.95599 type:complete len:210 (+) Transcript_36367:568-1197(+)